jgi:hypothetical protein
VRCETTTDPQAFWERTSDFLLRDPVVNNVLITNVSSRRAGGQTDPAPATYAAVIDNAGMVVGAAMRTPPFNVYVSLMPADAVEPLADVMVTSCPDAGGVTGTAAEAEALASAWTRRTGASFAVRERQRMYRLDTVVVLEAPPGRWRPAGVCGQRG